ncbi:outer membrane beta-barrel protein [Aquabacterium sp.]|uniref:outer membrane beta-barrel protein n=1 Tax=Aquabacterium sp. TaxID=1872578 RepID=UPI002C0C9853|nr:outer membrane beta-barrel protein [Aquabacterium sp.]HSW07340.1 outer membrane beta-barrel protein [Aquabacterium sp.]
MTIRTRQAAAGLIALAGLAALPAHAEGLYAGGALGTPRYPDAVNGISGNGSGLSGKLFGGYQFTPNLSLETGFAGLGHIDDGSGRVSGRAAYLDLLGTLPLNDKWSALGRLGVAHVKLDSSTGDSSGSGPKLGLGLQYALTTNVALRGEWERYHPSVFGEKPNIDQYTLGFRVGF